MPSAICRPIPAARNESWLDEDWEVSFTITDAPTLIPRSCTTQRDCLPTCDTSCVSR